MGHDHSHKISIPSNKYRSRLKIALIITLAVVGIQIIGAYIAESLSLLADAGHMLSDSAGLFIALFASWIAARPASNKKTYGYLRAEMIAALANAVLLLIMGVFIAFEAIKRFGNDPEINYFWMLIIAIVGAVANTVSVLVLKKGKDESLNLRGAYLEVWGDLLGSVAVIIAALIIAFTGFTQADAIASCVIAAMIFPRALGLLRDVFSVLLEGTPSHIDINQLKKLIQNIDRVIAVHDIHLWTITTGVPAFTAHIVIEDKDMTANNVDILTESINTCLSQHFGTDHTTIQIESKTHAENEKKLVV